MGQKNKQSIRILGTAITVLLTWNGRVTTKDWDFYKDERHIFRDWIKTSSNAAGRRLRASHRPGHTWRESDTQGWGHNAIRCCHFFRNRTMLSSSVQLWGFRERKQGLGCPRRMLGQKCRTRRSGQGIGGFEARNDIRSAVKRGRDTGRVGKADVRMSSPATQTLKLCCAWQFLRPCWPGFD